MFKDTQHSPWALDSAHPRQNNGAIKCPIQKCGFFVLDKLSTSYKNQRRNPAVFCGGRTRVYGEAYSVYVATDNYGGQSPPTPHGERRTTPTMKNEVLRQKDHLWMDTSYITATIRSSQEINLLYAASKKCYGTDKKLLTIPFILRYIIAII